MPIHRLVLGAAVLLLAGCASDDIPQVFSPYLEETFTPWVGEGRANIQGQGFYKMPSGRLISCAGNEVSLIPANGYNVESLQSIGLGKGLPENYNKRAFKFIRKTICDGAGRFSYQNVPTQNWIVLIHLSWQEADSMMFWSKSDKGGSLYQEILLDPGDNKVVLSNQEFVADQ